MSALTDWCRDYDLGITAGRWYPARCIDTDCAAAATCARDVVGHPHVNWQELHMTALNDTTTAEALSLAARCMRDERTAVEALAALGADLRALHMPVCAECGDPYPCSTVQAVDRHAPQGDAS